MAVETPGTAPSSARPCPNCGRAMAPAQDWCLECGTAAPGRFTGPGRAGIRAAVTIVSAVLLLVGGAVAASYAALNSKAQQAATATAPPNAAPQVAAAPPTTAPAPAPPPAPVAPPPAATPAPAPATPAPAPKPAAATKPAAAPKPKPKPAPKPQPAGHRPLDLGVDIASVYDPDKAATDQTDPADSYDANGKTVFTVTTARDGEMGVGLDFDLETLQRVEKVYFRTTTPGFTVEIYGAEGKLPPDILDTRWKHLATRKAAATDKSSHGLVKLTFDPGRYRHVVLWFTTPPPSDGTAAQPSDSAIVGISEVRILD